MNTLPFRPALRLACTSLAILGLVAATALAGFDWGPANDPRKYDGEPLLDMAPNNQKAAIQCAIDTIKMMANSDPSKQNRETMKRAAECLEQMLKGGSICQETGTTGAKAVTESEKPRKCTWTGDKINVKPGCISKAEPAFSKLLAALLHEAIHCLQWPDGSGLADTPAQQEWVAYEWEIYILCRRLAEATLTPDERANIQKRKDFLKGKRDTSCNTALTEQQRARENGKQGGTKDSHSQPNKTYEQDEHDSSKIVVGDELSSYDIQTPFAETYDLDVVPDPDGPGDLLLVCGVFAPGGGAGAVAFYSDNTADGLADQATERLVGPLQDPLALGFGPADAGGPARTFVLELVTHAVRTILDTGSGQPDFLLPQPFAVPAGYPLLADMHSLRSGGGAGGQVKVLLGPTGEWHDFRDPTHVDLELTDLNADFIADQEVTLGWREMVVHYVPEILNDVQQGDTTVMAAALSGRSLQVFATDVDALVLTEFLGQVFVTAADHASALAVPLVRPLVTGEHVVAVDGLNGEHATAGTLVEPARPEILSTDQADYLTGETVNVFGRNFAPGSVALVSGKPMPTTVLHSGHLTFPAPDLHNLPVNFFVLTAKSGMLESQIAGLYIVPDCNGNGLDDIQDIASGFSSDINENGRPDECERRFRPGRL